MTLQLSSECNSLTHYHCILQNVTENYLSFVPDNVVRAITQISNLSETDNYPGLIPTSSLSNSLSAINYFLPSASKLLENLVGSYISDQNLLETLFIAK